MKLGVPNLGDPIGELGWLNIDFRMTLHPFPAGSLGLDPGGPGVFKGEFKGDEIGEFIGEFSVLPLILSLATGPASTPFDSEDGISVFLDVQIKIDEGLTS